MDPEQVKRILEEELPDAEVEVGRPRGVDDDDHLAVTVVSPVFEGKNLVDQHDVVFDALDEHVTTHIHALEVTTYSPDQAP